MTIDEANKRTEELFIDCKICGSSLSRDFPRRKYCGNKHLEGSCSWKAWKLCSVRDKMFRRCYDENDREYKYYGKKGIGVCARWRSLEYFIYDNATKYEKGLTIDRIDNDKDYSKENCRWVDHKTQSRNRSITKQYYLNGKTYKGGALCEQYGIGYQLFFGRLKSGWSIKEALGIQERKRPAFEKIETRSSYNSKMYLGGICKNGHEYKNTGKSLRYKSCRQCKYCLGGQYDAI